MVHHDCSHHAVLPLRQHLHLIRLCVYTDKDTDARTWRERVHKYEEKPATLLSKLAAIALSACLQAVECSPDTDVPRRPGCRAKSCPIFPADRPVED